MMSRFAGALRRIDAMIDIPQPARSRMILEIAADMSDLYRHYIDEGIDPAEAERRTIEEFDLSPEEVAAIAEVHDTPLRRFLARYPARLQSLGERAALAFILIPAIAVAFRLAGSGGIAGDCGVWIWPLLAGSAAALGLSAEKFYRLFILKRHDLRSVRRGLDAPLYIAIGQLGLGFAGMYFDLYRVWTVSAADKASVLVHLVYWLEGSSALLSVSILAALFSAFAWLVNSGRAATIEQYEAETLLGTAEESAPGSVSEGATV